jgi:ABC-type nitrate/sulfonate/bicarbonate transport system permease component
LKRNIIFPIFFLIVAELFLRLPIIDTRFFPPPSSIVSNTFTAIAQSNLLGQIFYSLTREAIAFLIAAPLALLLALLCSHYKKLDDFFSPLIAFTFPLPKVAIFPLMLLIFGIDSASKIALISIGLFYLMFIHFRVGFLRLKSSIFFDVIRIYPFSTSQFVWSFLIKGSLQEIYTGLQVGFNYALTLVVVSEATVSTNGIGHFIWRSWDQYRILDVYSGVFVLCLIGFLQYSFFDLLLSRNRRYT